MSLQYCIGMVEKATVEWRERERTIDSQIVWEKDSENVVVLQYGTVRN